MVKYYLIMKIFKHEKRGGGENPWREQNYVTSHSSHHTLSHSVSDYIDVKFFGIIGQDWQKNGEIYDLFLMLIYILVH